MRMFKWLAMSQGLDRMWFVHNTQLSYEGVRDLDTNSKKVHKTTTLEQIYKSTKDKFGTGFLPGDYLPGEMWEQCRSHYYDKAMACRKKNLKDKVDDEEL